MWFEELPNLIKYYAITGKHTLDKDLDYLEHITKSNFQEETPYQIMHMMSTLLLWTKLFYTTIGPYPTNYDVFAIPHKELIYLENYLENPYKCPKPNLFQPTVLPVPCTCGHYLWIHLNKGRFTSHA